MELCGALSSPLPTRQAACSAQSSPWAPLATWFCAPAQSCPTLCDPMECSLPGFSVLGISQARILEWGAISSSRGSSRPRNRTQISCMAGRFFAIRATRQVKFILKMSNMGIQKHRQNLESLPLCPLLLLPVSFLCLSQGADISLSSVSSAPPNTQ